MMRILEGVEGMCGGMRVLTRCGGYRELLKESEGGFRELYVT